MQVTLLDFFKRDEADDIWLASSTEMTMGCYHSGQADSQKSCKYDGDWSRKVPRLLSSQKQ